MCLGNIESHLQCSVNMAHQEELALSSKDTSQAEPIDLGDSGLLFFINIDIAFVTPREQVIIRYHQVTNLS